MKNNVGVNERSAAGVGNATPFSDDVQNFVNTAGCVVESMGNVYRYVQDSPLENAAGGAASKLFGFLDGVVQIDKMTPLFTMFTRNFRAPQ